MRHARLLLIPAAVLLAAGCSDKAPAGQAAPPVRADYDPTSYCELTQRLETAGEEAFADLGRNATPAQYLAAERSFVLDNQDLLGGLVSAAPAHLTDEVETFLSAMRQRGGLEDSGVSQREASAAEKRILGFEKRHC